MVIKRPIKKKAAKKDTGMGELLGALKTRPELVHALVFNHVRVKRFLKSKAARQLIPGADVRSALMKRVTHAGHHGFLHKACLKGTRL